MFPVMHTLAFGLLLGHRPFPIVQMLAGSQRSIRVDTAVGGRGGPASAGAAEARVIERWPIAVMFYASTPATSAGI